MKFLYKCASFVRYIPFTRNNLTTIKTKYSTSCETSLQISTKIQRNLLPQSRNFRFDAGTKQNSFHGGCIRNPAYIKIDVRNYSAGEKEQTSVRNNLDLTFDNFNAAYKNKTTWELVRAYCVYLLCSSNTLVDNNMQIMNYTRKILGKRLFELVMKLSFYGHFVAGEDEVKIKPVIDRMVSVGVHPILDYSVEDDLSPEEAIKREVQASKEEGANSDEISHLPQYQRDQQFADRRKKVESAKTYFYLNEATCERNLETFLKCLNAVEGYGDGVAAIKLTALGRPNLLLQISEVIAHSRQFMSRMVGGGGNVMMHHARHDILTKRLKDIGAPQESIDRFFRNVTEDEEGLIHLFPWSGIINSQERLSESFFVPDLATGKMVRLITKLSDNEEEMFQNMIRRISTVMSEAEKLGVSVMVDAEQTYFQPAISRLTLELMRKYNKERPVVMNTYQCYLRDIMNELTADLEQARRQGFHFGAKLVRGAYLEQERERALALDYPDPTNVSYEATSNMYHKALRTCIRRMKENKEAGGDSKKVVIMVASHNEDTVRYTIQSMTDHGITPEDKTIVFGQLYGMCDYITFPLGQSGYMAYKYIPYGPVLGVLPYLSRRTQENKGILKKIKKEKRLLRKELFSRIMHFRIFGAPKKAYAP